MIKINIFVNLQIFTKPNLLKLNVYNKPVIVAFSKRKCFSYRTIAPYIVYILKKNAILFYIKTHIRVKTADDVIDTRFVILRLILQ